ncbi:MAG: carbohydrate ABC transporter permease [Thermodesulfobacteriota bacterium]
MNKKTDIANAAVLALLTAFACSPLLWLLLVSVRPAESLYEFPPPLWIWPTGNHFIVALKELGIAQAVGNSIIITAVSLVVNFFTGIPAAYALAKGHLRYTTAIMLSVIATQMIPGMAALVPLFQITKYLGLIDTRLGVALILAARTTPLTIWILKGFFEKIPQDLIEAAQVDGLKGAGIIYKIVLPLAWPGIIAAGLFVFMMSWIDFLVPLTLLFDPAKMPFTVALYQVVGDPLSGTNYGALFAASILGSLPVVLLFLLFQRYFIHGLTAGAVKG